MTTKTAKTMTFAQTIKRWRKRAKLTQQSLANALGTTVTTVSRWETGRSTPDLETMKRIGRQCGLVLTLTTEPKKCN